MPIDVNEILEACEVLARQDNLNVCLQESFKGAAVAGLGSFLGGVVMGPPGIAIGATVGGVCGAMVCREYKPLLQVLHEMDQEEKQRLATHLTRFLNKLDVTDAVLLMTLVSNGPGHLGRDALVKELGAFLGKEIMPR